MRRALGIAVLLVGCLGAAPAAAAPVLRPIGDFASPVAVSAPPGDPHRLLVVEKAGTVREVKDGALQAAPFLDVTAITRSSEEERGLLSIAFPPDYQQTGLFYAFLTGNGPPLGQIEIREFHRADADHADPGAGRLVLAIRHDLSNHNGGDLQFGPDGLLWIGVGDGGGANDTEGNAQDTTSLKGKLLRIDPRTAGGRAYTVPADNPFHNEVWAYGLRNPWRFSFDRSTGDLVIGDVGQGAHEEVDVATRAGGLRRGANYGWPCWEGNSDNSGSTAACPSPVPASVPPVIDQDHADGWCAIVGGYVVRDPGLPTLSGRYLYGDDCLAATHRVDLAAGQSSDAPSGLSVDQLSSFGEDACGHVFAASLAGPVYQLVDGAPSACPLPAGTPPPSAGPPVTVQGTRCRLSVRTAGRGAVLRRRSLAVILRASAPCRATVTGRIPGIARFTTAHRSLRAHRRVTVRLRLTHRGVSALRGALRRRSGVTARLRVRGVNAAGARVVTRRPRLTG